MGSVKNSQSSETHPKIMLAEGNIAPFVVRCWLLALNYEDVTGEMLLKRKR